MNMFEAEDTVKGLPDDYLFNEAQYPSGQLPQFLVVSEIQRRQSMRARHEAYSPQPEGTVKDQILGQQPQMAPQASPEAPQGIAAAAMAPGMQQPQQPVQMAHGGIAPGGTVYMGAGGEAPARNYSWNMFQIANVSDAEKARRAKVEQQNRAMKILMAKNRGIPIPEELLEAGVDPVQSGIASVKSEVDGNAVRRGEITPDGKPVQQARSSLLDQGIARANAFKPPAPPPVVEDEVPAAAPSGIASLGGGYSSAMTPREQAYEELMNQQKAAGIPAPVDLQKYMDAANQRGEDSSEYARQMAIAQALTGLGSGLMAGTPDLGMKQASDDVFSTLGAGREEANTERRAAEQIALQQATQDRQHKLDTMGFEREIAGEMASGERSRMDKALEFGLEKMKLDIQKTYYESTGAESGLGGARLQASIIGSAKKSAKTFYDSWVASSEGMVATTEKKMEMLDYLEDKFTREALASFGIAPPPRAGSGYIIEEVTP